jgi:hypothetical protein
MKEIGIYKDGELEKREDEVNKIIDEIYSEIVSEEVEKEIRGKKRRRRRKKIREPWVCRDDADRVLLLRPPRLPNKFLEELRRIRSELRDRRHIPRFEDRWAADTRTVLFSKESERDIVWFHYDNKITSLTSILEHLQRVYTLEHQHTPRFKIHVDFGFI